MENWILRTDNPQCMKGSIIPQLLINLLRIRSGTRLCQHPHAVFQAAHPLGIQDVPGKKAPKKKLRNLGNKLENIGESPMFHGNIMEYLEFSVEFQEILNEI